MSRRRARGEPHSAMDGSLCDHSVRKLLELCQRHRLTGVLHVTSWGRSGRVEIRAGEITTAAFGTHQGHDATTELFGLRDGLFELHQHLPSVEAAGQRGQRLPLSAVTEQCRTRALSCRVEVASRKQRAVITYRAGELESLEVDGGPLPEGLDAGQVLAPFENGQVHVEALPLSLHDPASPEAVTAQASQANARPVPRPADREDSRPARVSPPAARDDSRPNRAPAAPPPAPPAARGDSRPNRTATPQPLAAREDSRPNRAAPPPVPLAAREDSRPNRAAPPPVPLAAREDSRPNRAAPPPVPLAAREDSRPNRAAPPPVPLAARQDSRPTRVPAAPPLAAREDSRPNRAPSAPAGARPVPRPKVAPVVNPTLHPMPLQPSSAATAIPVALGRSQDGSGAVSGVRPWFDNPDPAEVTASLRNALSSRRELAVPALVTLVVVSLLLIIGFVALQP